MERAGFDPAGTAWRLFRADLVGQLYLMAIHKRFPHNQRRFAETCLVHGFDVGILDEIRFIPDASFTPSGPEDGGEGKLALVRS